MGGREVTTPSASLVEQGGVLRLRIDRPDKLNAIDGDVEAMLWQAIRRLAADPELRVLLIESGGRYFSAGFDVSHRVDDDHDRSGVVLRHRYREIHDLFDRLETVEKPVVVAVHGPCLGGALELALSCDFRLASTEARFALPEIELGVLPGSGGTSRLTRMVGPAWARYLTMAGCPVDADRALTIGLVHEVHALEGFRDRVDRFVERLAGLPGEAVGLAKLAIDLSAVLDRGAARDVERIANTLLMQSDDHRARVAQLKARMEGSGSTT